MTDFGANPTMASTGDFPRSPSTYSCIRQEQRSSRQGVWGELWRMVQSAWPSFGTIGIFLVVGYCTCHETGPSVIVSILIAGISCIISGCCHTELVTRPFQAGDKVRNVFQVLGMFPFFIATWLDIQIHICLLSICSRSLTATVDKTTDHRMHDFVLQNFGLTPFLGTFPDFAAGSAVMVPALLVACGFEHSKTLNALINIITALGFALVAAIGFQQADAKIFGDQPILIHGSKGVLSSIGLISILLSGSGSRLALSHLPSRSNGGQIGTALENDGEGGAKAINNVRTTSIPSHLLIMLANGFSQIGLILGFLTIGLVLPFVTKLSPLGLVPEVPILQAFESDMGHGLVHLVLAGTIIVALALSLLQLTIPLHHQVQSLVQEGLIFPWLSKSIPHKLIGDTPFLGSVLVGTLTAAVATLGDINHLLLATAGTRIFLDLLICNYTILARYGLITQCLDQSSNNNPGNPGGSGSARRRRLRREAKRKQREHEWDARNREETPRCSTHLADFASMSPNTHGAVMPRSRTLPTMGSSFSGDTIHLERMERSEPEGPIGNKGWSSQRLRIYFQKLRAVTLRRAPPSGPSGSATQFLPNQAADSQSSLFRNFSQGAGSAGEPKKTKIGQKWSRTFKALVSKSRRHRRGREEHSDLSETSLSDTSHSTESSNPSDYGTDTSASTDESSTCDSSSSSEIDIDHAVAEFNQGADIEASPEIATISLRPMFQSYEAIFKRNKKPPSLATFYRMLTTLVLVLICLLLQILVFNGLSVAAYPNVIIFNMIMSMLVFPMVVFISQQPQDRSPEVNGEATQFRVPFMPWLPLLAIFLNLNVLATLIGRTWPDLCAWIIFGLLIFTICSNKSLLKERSRLQKTRMGNLLDAVVNRPLPGSTPLYDLPIIHGYNLQHS